MSGFSLTDTRSFGRSSLTFGPITFGGAALGNLYHRITEEEAQQALQTAWHHGIRSFDTAPEYGKGLSERRFGDFLRHKDKTDYILCTKTGELLLPEPETKPSKFVDSLPFHRVMDFSGTALRRGLEDSLQRLGLDHVDILLLHDLDPIILKDDFESSFQCAMKDGLPTLLQLKEEGLIQAIGLGVKCHTVCERALEYADFDCFMLQGNYTLLEQPAEEFLTACGKNNRGIFIAGPFASGILATGVTPEAHFHHQPASADIRAKVSQIAAICEEYKTPLPTVALQFPLKNNNVTSVACGFDNAQQVEDACQWLQQDIPQALWQTLYQEGFICKQLD